MDDSGAVSATTRSGHLLERGRELGLLTESAEFVGGNDAGTIVLVAGEAGSGKTTLLRTFCEQEDARTLWGRCDPLFAPRPLGPLLDIADMVGGELPQLLRGEATPHDVVALLARELRDRPGTIFVLEDVHWADAATLDVVKLVARRIESVPVLIALSYRNDGL